MQEIKEYIFRPPSYNESASKSRKFIKTFHLRVCRVIYKFVFFFYLQELEGSEQFRIFLSGDTGSVTTTSAVIADDDVCKCAFYHDTLLTWLQNR